MNKYKLRRWVYSGLIGIVIFLGLGNIYFIIYLIVLTPFILVDANT